MMKHAKIIPLSCISKPETENKTSSINTIFKKCKSTSFLSNFFKYKKGNFNFMILAI